MIKFIPVESSNIEAVGYSDTEVALYVRFKNGQTWRYMGVHKDTYKEMLSYKSKGAYLSRMIKPKHEGEKMHDDTGAEEEDDHGIPIQNSTPRAVKSKTPAPKEETAKVSIRLGSIDL